MVNFTHKPLIKLLVLIFIFINCGCAGKTKNTNMTKKDKFEKGSELLTQQIIDNDKSLIEKQKTLQSNLQKKPTNETILEPVMPEYDPLEDHVVSFSIIDESLETLLYSLSQSVGMNIIIDPEIKASEKKLSMNFDKVSASTVLTEIIRIFDIHYEIKNNIIRVTPYQEKMFKLNFLDTSISTTFDVGGDVLGSGETSNVSGLKGGFTLSGEGSKETNSYDILEKSIKKIISNKGRFSINRLSGSLYIKDSPSVVATISKLVSHYKKMLSKQILLEARIIEVVLSNDYKYGIDWKVVTDKASDHALSTSTAWGATTGIVLGFKEKHTAIDFTLDALKTFGESKVVSNPSIRSKHGQPAIISVGTSITYIKSEEKESSSTSSTTSDTTTIETSNVFDGLILGLIPFVDDDDKITLLINPIKSDVEASSLELVGTISLPKVNIKELSSTISMNNNETIILGGLIDKRKSNEQSSVPILSKIPVLGNLFKYDFNDEEARELVIILSVTII